MKITAQKTEDAGKGNNRITPIKSSIPYKDKVSSFCGYCGTQSTGVKVELVCGNSTLLCDEDVAEKLMEVKTKAEKPYWVKVCPACGFAVGVIQ